MGASASAPNWQRWNRIVWASLKTPDAAARTTAYSWKRCCGLCGRAVPGVICQPCSATGALRSGGFVIGAKPMFSSGFSMLCRRSPTWNTPWWMPPSSRFTGMARAQKGTQSQAIGRSKGGMTTKILADRCLGQSCPLGTATREPLRYHRRRTADRGDRVRGTARRRDEHGRRSAARS